MIRRVPVLLACAMATLCVPATAQVVRTDTGAVRGVKVDEGLSFRGIPYAAPPVGGRRWRAPEAAARWTGVRDATRFGPDCIQPDRGRPAWRQSEDCLTLSVVTPDVKAKRLPVIVSLHGGAFAFGTGRSLADGGAAAIVRRGVVLVSPNYRVGRFGFLAHPALTAEAAGGATANFWLMDQIAALRWVRRNITRFGGDPANVTILGCSAGGSSVNAMLVSPAARGLFAKASVHSGGGIFNASRPLATAEAQGVAFASRVGVQGADAAALQRLRALPPTAILAGDPGPPDYGAIVDGVLLPMGTARAFATGAIARVPLMVGSTSNEASVFGLMGFDAAVLKRRFGVDVAALRPLYEAEGRLSDAELLRQVQTDFLFTSAAVGTSAAASRAGLPSWAYHFAYLGVADRDQPGVPHCGDMPYSFGTQAGQAAEDRRVAAMMQDYLVNFVTRGDPNAAGLPAWPQIRTADGPLLLVDRRTTAVSGFRTRQIGAFLSMAAQPQ